MSSVGRKPLPTETHKLNGNPSKKKLNENEPSPEVLFALPSPPSYLGEYGIKEWWRVGPVLIKNKLLTEADMMTFESYCINVNILVAAQVDIEENGMTVRGDRGGRVRNPAVVAVGQATTAIRAFAAEFGMSPSSRSRIKLPTEDDGLLDALMTGTADDGAFDQGV
jgi:P27 family predicted phage terminase small subunit